MKYVLLLSSLLLNTPLWAQQCEKGKADLVPTSRYRLQGPLATDTKTGLTWRRCGEGQTWSGKGCGGTAVMLNVKDSIAWVDRVNSGPAAARQGFTDWRLPSQDELASLIAGQCSNPAINNKVFPATQSAPYWTANSPGGTGQWAVSFADGFEEIFNASRNFPLRLVRK